MTNEVPFNPNLILSVGTQVVTRVEVKNLAGEVVHPAGAVGVIIKSPLDNTHAYRVRFADESEFSFNRPELVIQSHFKEHASLAAGSLLAAEGLYDYVIYRCVVGSRAFGLDSESSDIDRRGIYLPPAEWQWSLYGVPEQLENKAAEECYWEVQKFLGLALKANPNILECLYTPLVEMATPLAEELLTIRAGFLSRLVYQTYNGYVVSQMEKMEQHRRNHNTIRWKHAMHLIRLLLAGITILQEGYVPVKVEAHREELLAIKRGEVVWEEVNKRRLSLHKEFDAALASTKLPERPDYTRANAFLVKARRSMVDKTVDKEVK